MLIIGAKGFAKEVIQIIEETENDGKIYFYDDQNKLTEFYLYDKYEIKTSLAEVIKEFEQDNLFTIGIGRPALRKKMYDLFVSIGGVVASTISKESYIGKQAIIGEGANILAGVKISNNVVIGKCPLIYYNVVITHDNIIGDFVELSPSVNILGNVKVGNYTHLGANCTILPNVTIGENCIVGAGSVVTKDIPDNTTVVGVPAKAIKVHK